MLQQGISRKTVMIFFSLVIGMSTGYLFEKIQLLLHTGILRATMAAKDDEHAKADRSSWRWQLAVAISLFLLLLEIELFKSILREQLDITKFNAQDFVASFAVALIIGFFLRKYIDLKRTHG